MKPTIVFGDIHGLTRWKEIVERYPEYRFIFLGDYLDPYSPIPGKQLIINLREIIEFKKSRKDVILLLGNHDLHYFCDAISRGSRYDESIQMRARWLFEKNRECFQYAFQDGKTVFVHAGISHDWFVDDFGGDIQRNIAEQLNNPTDEQLQIMCRAGYKREGDWRNPGIFWADMAELENPLHGYDQVVGHNRVYNILDWDFDHDNRITFCDSLFNGNYLMLG